MTHALGQLGVTDQLETAIRQQLMPALFGKELSDLERKVVALPARFGGLGMRDPTAVCEQAFANSQQLTAPLVALLLAQQSLRSSDDPKPFKPKELKQKQRRIRSSQAIEAEKSYKAQKEELLDQLPKHDDFRLAIQLASEKRASAWLTARPTHAHETVLHKRDFRDAIRLRYAWKFPDLPEFCGCGQQFGLQHALTCLKGGFRTMGHDELRDVYQGFMQAAGYKDIVSEPELQPLTGELLQKFKTANRQDDARSDLAVIGFWTRRRRAYFDFVSYSPYARSYRKQNSDTNLRSLEQRKRRQYQQRIEEIEHGDFSPMAFSITGGVGSQADIVTKRLSAKLAAKQEIPKSVVAGWMNCRISFAVLRSALVCIRGSRPLRPKPADEQSFALAAAESAI